MIEVLLVLFALFFVYLYLPASWLSGRWPEKRTLIPTAAASLRANKPCVPEDAVLRRHFISHLRREIEAALHPRPTDSILQRHYDALVEIKLEQRLTEFGRLQSC